MGGFVYFMSNRKDGPIYVGVTSDLAERIFQHQQGVGSAFCRRYGLDRLVYYQPFDRIEDAIAQEKRIKKWRRAWKVNLIEETNKEWADLSGSIH